MLGASCAGAGELRLKTTVIIATLALTFGSFAIVPTAAAATCISEVPGYCNTIEYTFCIARHTTEKSPARAITNCEPLETD